MGSFNVALLNTLISVGVHPDRAREVVDLFDRSVDERYGLHAQVLATKRDVAELETRLTREIALLDKQLAQRQAESQGRIAELESRLVQGLANCDTRIAESKADVVKWLLGALTAQTALIAGIVKLF